MAGQFPAVYEASTGGAIRQGEILSGLHQYRRNIDSLGQDLPVLDTITHPIAIVATQDCDLDIDFTERQKSVQSAAKIIPSVLICYVVSVETLRKEGVNAGVFRTIRDYNHDRYYHLDEVPAALDTRGEGLPAAVIDFKKYFTLPTDELYFQVSHNATRRCKLCSPFLEHFATRFRNYQSRIALPNTGE